MISTLGWIGIYITLFICFCIAAPFVIKLVMGIIRVIAEMGKVIVVLTMLSLIVLFVYPIVHDIVSLGVR
jgi:hypothetical protein